MKTYQSIQYLRAVAALLVVFFHARGLGPGDPGPLEGLHFGEAGVDVFFVISGFIMHAAARDEAPLEFLRRRLVRIAPLYWVATLAITAIFLKNAVLEPGAPLAGALVQSLLFIPHYNLQAPTEVWPVLVAGWTLNYEMLFYLIFAVGIASRRLVPFVAAAILTLVSLGAVVDSDTAGWVTATSPLLLEFLAGMMISRFADRLSWPPTPVLLPLGVAGLIAGGQMEGARVLFLGLPAAMLVAGAVAIEQRGRLPALPVMGLLGDASYSIYLFHAFATGKLAKLSETAPLSGDPWVLALLWAGAGVAASAVLGVGVYLLVERPLRRLLAPRPRPPIAPAWPRQQPGPS